MNAPAKSEGIVAYKAFNKDFACTGGDKPFQYEVGKTYTHEGPVKSCEAGFHACENPLDVLNFYPLIDDHGNLCRFGRVTLSGKIDRSDSKKCAAGTIAIEVELSLPEWVSTAVKWLANSCKGSDAGVASGDYSQLAASGDYSKLAASGCSSQLAASGYSSKLAASGDSSQLAASGDYSKLELTGSFSAAAAVGVGSRIKAGPGCPIAICEYSKDGKPLRFVTGIAGQDGVPADVWLEARNGKFVEVSA